MSKVNGIPIVGLGVNRVEDKVNLVKAIKEAIKSGLSYNLSQYLYILRSYL